jgi:threonine dehydrogenase-like Zn-dependent dehydrogenase
LKALTYAGKERIRLEEIPDPQILDPLDAILKIRMTAICGSDLHVYHQREKGLDPGTAMGHECVGEIVEVGSEVTAHERGDLVICPFTTSCGKCFYCRHQLTSRCEKGLLFGWVQDGRGLQGTQAEYLRVPLSDSTLLALPEALPLEEGLLLGDVFSTGFFCAELGGVAPGVRCAVVGCGPVGIMAIAAARHLGAEEIYCIDSIAERLELGRRFGATPLDYEREDPLEIIRGRTGGRGVDVALEVVGLPAAMRAAVDLVRPGGVIASVGVHTDLQFSFSPVEAYDKNLTYRSGRCPARHYMERLLPMVRERRYPLDAVISHRMALSEGVRGYEIFDEKREGCTKIVLSP